MNIEYFLFVTNDCNLNCGYCSVVKSSIEQSFPKVIDYKVKDLEHFIFITQQKHNAKSFDIIFFGGEPSLDLKNIYSIIDDFESVFIDYEVNYILHSNGLLLGNIESKYLNKIKLVILSINNHKIKQFNLSEGYFRKIIDNVQDIKTKNNKIEIMARLTVTEDISLYSNVLQLSNFFDYIFWQLQNCENFKDFSSYYKNYCYDLEMTFQYWLNYLSKGFMIELIPFQTITQSFLKHIGEELNGYLCGFNSYSVYIQTNGICYSCPEGVTDKDYIIGNIWNGITFQETKMESKCNNCSYISVCHGRCAKMQLSFNKDHINEYCELNKYLFKLIENNIEQLQSFYKENPRFVRQFNNMIFKLTEYVP